MKINNLISFFKTRLRIGRKYKDGLFCSVFGKDKKALLQLYNALNDTAYDDENKLEIVTIENVIYITMKNDVAFILCGTINLYEHQSTDNPNIPARFLIYLADEYQKIIEKSKMSVYGSKLISLPAPRCVVFYNGDEDFITKEYNLSDAFEDKDIESDVSLRVRVININYGFNKELMNKCKTLSEYAMFVQIVREYQKIAPLKEALNMAIEYAINHGILEEYFRNNRAEVLGMLLYDFDEKKFRRTIREEGYEEGIEQGIEQGTSSTLLCLIKSGEISIERAADIMGISKEEFEEKYAEQLK